jgi:hypothetical protein
LINAMMDHATATHRTWEMAQRRSHQNEARAFSRFIQENLRMTDTAVLARRREIAVEHVLFKLIEYVEQRQPGLLEFIEASLDHLGDPAHDETKDDDAVRQVARKMIEGARNELGG